jgi:hypothetical protein
MNPIVEGLVHTNEQLSEDMDIVDPDEDNKKRKRDDAKDVPMEPEESVPLPKGQIRKMNRRTLKKSPAVCYAIFHCFTSIVVIP